MSEIFIFLTQALLIVVLPPVLMRYFRVGSAIPLVVVQILFGLALGPSCLGRISPAVYTAIFPPSSLNFLAHVSAVALFFFALTTGMHLDMKTLKGHGRMLGMVATASMLVPLLLGVLAGLAIAGIFPLELNRLHSTLEFALSIGICSGVTALPVLAAILREMDLIGSRLGQFALALAAVNDGMLWILLAVFLSVIRVGSMNSLGLFATSAHILLYFAAIFGLVRPLLAFWARRSKLSADTTLIIACGVAIVSAAATEQLGLHYLLGAFLAGAVMPQPWRETLLERIQPLTVNILIPFFFISTGLKALIDVTSPGFLEITVVLTACAIVGKVLGTSIAARFAGEPWPFCLGLGALAQAKGLMELVVATILLDAKVISSGMFSAMILMALISSALAMPLLRLVMVRQRVPEWT
jgi:Kef-type K+ transport system membrane component KefB